MSSRSVLSVLALVTACAEPPELGEIESSLVATSKVTSRGVNITPDILEDWSTDSQISQALVTGQTLKVRYCAEHFPPGSQVLANLEKAVNAYSIVAGVAIEITDVAPEPGTETHPQLSTFTYPSDAIYLDFKNMDDGVYAGASFLSCDNSSPRQCTRAKIMINEDSLVGADPVADATSVGVFMHELGHVFGMRHINDQNDSEPRLVPSAMVFDRVSIHGYKTHATDFRSNLIHAGTLGMLQTYYPDLADPALATDEIVAHHNMSTVDGDTHVEWNPSKTYIRGVAESAIEDLNETKLRWNNLDNTFEPCSNYGTLPRWFARMSETSTNTTNTPFESVFEITNSSTGTSWTEVATHTFDSVGTRDLRQIDWEKTFRITLADVGLSIPPLQTVDRKLRFRADSNSDLSERNENNNEWWVNVCLYPTSDTTCARECSQPSSPEDADDDDDEHDD